MNPVAARILAVYYPGTTSTSLGERQPDSAKEALEQLRSEFSIRQLQRGIEHFLYEIVDMYDSGKIPYHSSRFMADIPLGAALAACLDLVIEGGHFELSRYQLRQVVRTLPVLEWYHGVRRLISVASDGVDVLVALYDGLCSRKPGQIYSASIGLVFYADQTGQYSSWSAARHVLSRIAARIDVIAKSPSIPFSIKLRAKAAESYLNKWHSPDSMGRKQSSPTDDAD